MQMRRVHGSGIIAAATALAFVVSFGAPARAADELTVEVKLAKEVQEHQPVDPSNTFPPGEVYCWNLVKGGEGDFRLFHLWSREGKQVRKQGVRVKGKKWITWSHHKVGAGAWKVEVADAAGKVLASAEFTVK
jgi:hypothetical protein